MEKLQIGHQVLYKNNQLIAFNKATTVPVQTQASDTLSLLSMAEKYCQHPLHLIHRLDQPASGVILMAKNKKALAHLNRQFQERKVEKSYLAVVKNEPPEPKGQLSHFLARASSNKTKAVDASYKGAKEAILEYELIGKSETYHLLRIKLLTGRHHQIRAQLAAIDCPIKGDVKYGFRRSNKDRSIHLHAWKLQFTHPTTLERETIIAPLPEDPVWNAFATVIQAK
ncbi:MAG: RluA family pseudouridine synthase [Saprospiraceae bacterium]|nr:RluA family pseudouridine synthase [Saprospiraceae bacterium]